MRSLLLLLACAAGCADASLVVSNRSDFEIYELYITQVENPSWGENQLDAPLQPGDAISLDVCCGVFDTLLIDETGAACEALDVELCFEKDDWVIRNTTCRVFDVR